MANSKDIIHQNLDRFGYDYVKNGQGFEVKLGFKLRTTINLADDDRVLMTDRLDGWNILTGMIRFKDLTGAIRYTWIGMAVLYGIALVLMQTMEDKDIGHAVVVFIQLVSTAWVLITLSATLFYLIKAEGFRLALMGWVRGTSS